MSSNKKSLLRTILASHFGCGCGCSGQDPSQVFEPIPIPKISNHNPNPRSSVTSSTVSGEPNGGFSVEDDDFTFTSNTISEAETDRKTLKLVPKQSPKLMNSIAIEKESEDPYKDFRHSMLQMIFEEEIFSETDLQDLLECFLQLNPPCHHEIIVRAFTRICEEAFAKKK